VLSLTDDGRAVLARAVPIWAREHGALDEELGGGSGSLRGALKAIA
jgi:DNA-binding transcriptional LysR family regulator